MIQPDKRHISPFLKWPGGKRWISHEIARVIGPEIKQGSRYFEPFLGAGAVYLRLEPNDALLSDVNKELIRFIQICCCYPEEVVAATWRFSNTKECYYRVRASKPRNDVTWAARFLYLNRTCWGGVYRLNRQGEFNVPFGNSGRQICSKETVLDAINVFKCAEFASHDFEYSFSKARSGDAVYADPPYTSRGQYNGFIRYNESLFSWADQCRLAVTAKSARQRGVFVAISGVMHRDILALYKNWWLASLMRKTCVARKIDRRVVFNEVLLLSRRPRTALKDIKLLRVTDETIASVPSYD